MPETLRIALCQDNFLVGAFAENSAKIIAETLRAKEQFNADLIAFPELAICGYPPEDLLLRQDFYVAAQAALQKIAAAVTTIDIVVGFPEKDGAAHYNSVAWISGGKVAAVYRKQRLPNESVFDEKRYFKSGTEPTVITVKNIKIALLVCEDVWGKQPVEQARAAGAELLLSLNASPFDLKKAARRLQAMKSQAEITKTPIVYVNCVGGQDELIFDGGSMVLDAEGNLKARARFFVPELFTVDFSKKEQQILVEQKTVAEIPEEEELAYQALVLGTREYIEKNHFKGAMLGLSGGIDSALVLAIAVDAIGKERVFTYALPSRYTSQMSLDDGAKVAANFGVSHKTISIEPVFQSYLQSLAEEFRGFDVSLTEENLQARCRGMMLMALSNQKGHILLATGNKSEMATGYATLYGDMAGGFCVLKDVSKMLVYRLAAYRNRLAGFDIIPKRIIERPPSAELKFNQKDSDTLPPYEILDAILALYIEKDASFADIVAAGFAEDVVKKVIVMVKKSEYKRRQAALGPRITSRAFGRDWRYPVTVG